MKGKSLLAVGAAALGGYAVWRATREKAWVGGHQPVEGPHIVVLGAGFAGISAMRELRRQLGRTAAITLVDQHNYHMFTPILYEVAAWGLDPRDIAMPVRQFTSRLGVEFRRACVRDIDLDRRRVELDDGEIDYDYLVIALGSTTNFFGNATAEEHTYPIKWLEESVAVNHCLIDRLEAATVTADPEEREELLTFVVVGGGPTGVETAAALQDMLNRVLGHEYAELDPGETHVILVEKMDHLLAAMGDRMAMIALDRLRAIGVDVRLNTETVDIGATHVTLSDGSTIRARTVMWTAGVRAPEVVSALPVPHGKGGGVVVDPYLRVAGRREVYAAGDAANVTDGETRRPVALLAQAAIQEGTTAGRNIVNDMSGEALEPFHYRSLGDAVSLGRWSGILGGSGFAVGGLLGWLGWRVIHLVRLSNLRNKLAIALDWSWGYIYSMDTSRLELEPARARE